MSDKTYIELCENSKETVQIEIWRQDGSEYNPSGAYYEIKGREKDNTIVPRSSASIDGNKVYTKVGLSVTASAAKYDLYWELRDSSGDMKPHCTKLLVIDTC